MGARTSILLDQIVHFLVLFGRERRCFLDRLPLLLQLIDQSAVATNILLCRGAFHLHEASVVHHDLRLKALAAHLVVILVLIWKVVVLVHRLQVLLGLEVGATEEAHRPIEALGCLIL